MTTAPYVELRVNPTDLRPGDLPKAGEYLGTPADAIEAALAMTRASMVAQMKAEVRNIGEPSHYQLLRIADLAWQAAFWRYRKVSAPVIADAYLHAYQAAEAGDVPMSVIYDLADKHAEKVGMYFHETSRQALADGFNSMVNRRIPARVAADRVLDAYGLTPRQMRGYSSAKQFGNPVSDVLPRSLKARARTYIQRSFTQRTRKLAEQEEHNIDEQAKQFAWMWLQDKGRLSEKAQKMWITAKDEKVCPVCGPLHGRKVGINEQFKTKEGDFWSPGLHPNCRCETRLIENRFSKAEWDPQLHPRAHDGRFGVKTRTKTLDVDEEFERITRNQPDSEVVTSDPQLDLKFSEITQYGFLPKAQTYVSSLPKASTYVAAPAPAIAPQVTRVTAPAIAPVKAPAKAKLKPITQTKPGSKTEPGNTGWMLLEDAGSVVEVTDQPTYATVKEASAAGVEKIVEERDQWYSQLRHERAKLYDEQGNPYHLTAQQTKQFVDALAQQAQSHAKSPVEGPTTTTVAATSDSGGTREFPVSYLADQLDVKFTSYTLAPASIPTSSETIEDPLDPTAGTNVGVSGRYKLTGGRRAGRTKGRYSMPILDSKKLPD